jgi:hypothetical protein
VIISTRRGVFALEPADEPEDLQDESWPVDKIDTFRKNFSKFRQRAEAGEMVYIDSWGAICRLRMVE